MVEDNRCDGHRTYDGCGGLLALERCTAVGNFAVRGRSGLRLEPEATAAITNSILWRNAGDSIEVGGGRVALAFSLNEDAGDPEHAVLIGSPGFVG